MPSFYARIKAAYITLCRPSIGTSFMTELKEIVPVVVQQLGLLSVSPHAFPLFLLFSCKSSSCWEILGDGAGKQ